MELQQLYAHATRCHTTLAPVLHAHPELLHREFVTTSRFNTIAKLLVHCNGAEEGWYARLIDKPWPPSYADRAPNDLESLLTDAETLRTQTLAFLAASSPESLAQVFTVALGRPTSLTAQEILFHIINHEQWHRAQIYTALQSFGIEPPNLDYVLLKI
ncbi:MAG: DinB family protein [Armatimonadetes bacterium]|nr:DinB family protein [Armatimonadota bacterium]